MVTALTLFEVFVTAVTPAIGKTNTLMHHGHVKTVFVAIRRSDALVDRDHARQPTHGPALEGQPHSAAKWASRQSSSFGKIFMAVVHHRQLTMPNGRSQRVKVIAPNGINLAFVPPQPCEEFPLQRCIEQGPTMGLESQSMSLAWTLPWFGIRHLASDEHRCPPQRLQRLTRLFDALIERQVIRNPNRDAPA